MLPSNSNRGMRVAAFDGGGINVLGELIIVWELMLRIQALYNLLELPLPCDFFDLICGTGTGGLVAILLGRLRLTINQAIECYVEILNRGFVKKGFGMGFGTDVFSATALETVLGEIVARHCGRADARMIEGTNQDNKCNVMVCAMSAQAIRGGIPTCIRTYRVSSNQGPDCTIVEAMRATMATPGMFKPALIIEQSIKIKYVGGGLGCNNATAKALEEAEVLFPGRPLSTVLSVGSGQLHSTSVPDQRRLSNFLPSKLVQTFESIATDCERTNQELSRRFRDMPNVYFRFNAEQGMQDIDQSDVARLPDVQAHTRNYLQDAAVTAHMDNAVRAIAAGVGVVAMKQGNVQSLRQPSMGIGRCPPPSRVFTGREDILKQMRDYFLDRSPMERHLFVLCGLGGSGKTQLALRFAQLHSQRFWDIFYIDATTRETISAGLISLAKAAKAGETPEDALSWLASREERWLLVFNNADDPSLNLQEFFPACTHGDILITTRNQQMRAHTHEFGSYCQVSGMLPDDAVELLLKASGAREEENAASTATQLVNDFGFFALAIVQSGAYIRAKQCGLARYRKLFQGARRRLLQERGVNQTDDYRMSVYASWDLSYRQLSPHASQLLQIMSFMHHEGISETIFDVASTRVVSYQPRIPLSESQTATKSVVSDFLSTLRNPSNEWDRLAFEDLTDSLRSFSLLDYDTHSGTYSMHPLVQEWCRSVALDATSVRECTAWLLSLCVNWEYDSDSYSLRRRLLPHLLALDSVHTRLAPDLALNLSLVCGEAGYDKQYEALTAIALQGSRDTLGNEHSQTLACMNNLAVALRQQGKSEEAAALLTEVIEIKKRVLGQEHPDTLSSMHVLASTYHDQKRWQEAEALLLEVIEARKRVNGVEHNHTLKSMGMLASTYWSQGRLSEAEALEVEVLETRQRVLGREHPDTLAAMHNLAMTYEEQGKLREAESLMEETVALKKKVLGESHPETNTSVGYLEHIQRRMQSGLGSSIS